MAEERGRGCTGRSKVRWNILAREDLMNRESGGVRGASKIHPLATPYSLQDITTTSSRLSNAKIRAEKTNNANDNSSILNGIIRKLECD